ncbi:MAG: alpha/beta fold hydrolase [Acidobacteria bacterium]|nr:alpha/beta fold hydrolase [Acidobacteriota bacterium]
MTKTRWITLTCLAGLLALGALPAQDKPATPAPEKPAASAPDKPAAAAPAEPPPDRPAEKAAVKPQDFAPYCGEYRTEGKTMVSVFLMGPISALIKPMFIDWRSLRMGELAAGGTDRFFSPRSPQEAAVHQTDLVFERDERGEVTGLVLTEQGQPPTKARKVEAYRREAVTFDNGDVRLAGTLCTPPGKGPHPAVVLVHGSGPGCREQLAVMASFFALNGVAALSYDKRGCGESGGDWKAVDLEALAADAVAGVQWLRQRPGIDPGKVGAWGISQGGWITPLAGAQSNQVAFVINHSGPGTSLRKQDSYMTASILKLSGIAPEDIDLVMAMYNTLYDFGRGKATAEALDAAAAKLKGKPGLEPYTEYTSANIKPAELYAQQAIGDPAWFFHLDPDRDALAPYRRLRCPVLVIYGRQDFTVPVEESEKAIRKTLEESKHPDYLVRVLENTGHGPALVDAANPMRPAVPVRVNPEYFDLLKTWLRRHGFMPGPAGAPGPEGR